MYLMVENGIRGGISTIMKRYAKANNPYVGRTRLAFLHAKTLV